MLDEIKTITIKNKDKEITLVPDFRAFKKLHKITGNAFEVMEQFVNDNEHRVGHLPVLIQSMATEELSIDEIENNVLGMQWSRVEAMATVIFELLSAELVDPIEAEENKKNVEIPNHQKD